MSESIGARLPRADAVAKVVGSARYAEDLPLGPGMLHAALLTSPHPHARIVRIDTREAEALRGVRVVVTGDDCPRPGGFMIKDRWAYAQGIVRYFGEAVAGVAADTLEIAREAVKRIHVEYALLPPVLDPEEAMEPGVTLLHPDLPAYDHVPGVVPYGASNVAYHGRLRKGDAASAVAEADLVLEETYRMPRVHHVPLENHTAAALYDWDGQLTIWSSAQGPHQRQVYFADMLEMPAQRVRVITPYVGGGFGGKSNTSVELFVVPLALKARGRSVRLVLTREEEFLLSFTRMSMVAHLRMGARRDGRILALESRYSFAAGAWADNGIGMADNARNGVSGAYEIPNVRADCYCVYTNHPGGGSYRGYGMPEVTWAIESHVDELARRLGLDPLYVRRLNGLREGSELPTGGRMHPTGLSECLDRVADALGWGAPLSEPAYPRRRGRGVAAVLKGPHGPHNLAAAASVKFNADGSADVLCGAIEMGQGTTTALAQIAAAELGLPVAMVRVQPVTDTAYSPYDWKSVGSRTTWMVGNAVAGAARDARRQCLEAVAILLGCTPDELAIRDEHVWRGDERCIPLARAYATGITDARGGSATGPIVGRGKFAAEGLEPQDPETGYSPKVKPYYTLGAQGVDLEVDLETGQITLLRVAAAFDVGRAINPDQVEGQITGGTAQGLSTAIFEDMVFPDGRLRNGSLVDYKIMTAPDSPVEWAVSYVEVPQDDGPFGARGVAEPPIVGAAPAVGNALRDALGIRFTELPLSPERIALTLAEGEPTIPGQTEALALAHG